MKLNQLMHPAATGAVSGAFWGMLHGGLATHDALGSILLTLLALGVFISGLDLRTWKLCVAGAFLALAVPFVAWFADAGLFIFLIGVVLIALGLLAWWGAHRSHRARLS